MRRIVVPVLLLAGVLALATASLADPGGKGKAKGGHSRFSALVVVPDHGTCQQNVWATDTSMRTWTVKKNNDSTFRVTRKDKGTFLTNAGQSPSACATSGKHGKLVTAGIHGKFRGYLTGTVSGGTFNPTATCAPACIGSTSAFIAAHFPGGTFTCTTGYAGCKFNFEYSSPDTSLIFHHWQDKGTNGVTEQFTGDIATS